MRAIAAYFTIRLLLVIIGLFFLLVSGAAGSTDLAGPGCLIFALPALRNRY